ncbi:hypothetical protein [Geothrix edaphica]|uniref:Uncharacterized protein n=1 Tax=Geothrix edaphica TaxID=2927976 RepID=A0ABQ5PY71_9BACT|nr:hypothetical protein [Geothrix edaphica]GLH67313.1 hypothetical protein GETHED_16770 [Geothrix edaphica]
MAVRSLKTQEDIRRALAHVYRELEADRVDPGKARVLIYCALSLSQVLGEHDLEKRVEALETSSQLRRTA